MCLVVRRRCSDTMSSPPPPQKKNFSLLSNHGLWKPQNTGRWLELCRWHMRSRLFYHRLQETRPRHTATLSPLGMRMTTSIGSKTVGCRDCVKNAPCVCVELATPNGVSRSVACVTQLPRRDRATTLADSTCLLSDTCVATHVVADLAEREAVALAILSPIPCAIKQEITKLRVSHKQSVNIQPYHEYSFLPVSVFPVGNARPLLEVRARSDVGTVYLRSCRNLLNTSGVQ